MPSTRDIGYAHESPSRLRGCGPAFAAEAAQRLCLRATPWRRKLCRRQAGQGRCSSACIDSRLFYPINPSLQANCLRGVNDCSECRQISARSQPKGVKSKQCASLPELMRPRDPHPPAPRITSGPHWRRLFSPVHRCANDSAHCTAILSTRCARDKLSTQIKHFFLYCLP